MSPSECKHGVPYRYACEVCDVAGEVAMSPEAQRIAIAEARGWSHRTIDAHTYWWHDENNKTLPPGDDGMRSCPDYLNDRNAMHEAVTALAYGSAPGCVDYIAVRDVFLRHLQRAQGNTPSTDRIITLSTGWCFLCASLSQLAEAFLKTLNLWDDTKGQPPPMSKTETPTSKADPFCQCDNCGAVRRSSNLVMIRDFWSRTEPGGIIPHGDCPDCGAFCYVATKEELATAAITRLLDCPAMNEEFEEKATGAARRFAREVLSITKTQ